jgi:hypothetical protein
VSYRVVRFHREDGNFVGIASEPRDKFTHVVVYDQPIRLLRVLNEEATAYITELPTSEIKRTAKRMLAFGRRVGITDGAKDALKEALQ